MKKKLFKICASVLSLAGVVALGSCTTNKPSSSSTPSTAVPTTVPTAPTTVPTAPTTVPTTPTTTPVDTTAQDLLDRIILQGEGSAISENFTVPASLKKGDEVYQINWTSNNAALVVAEEAVNGTYAISIVRPATDVQTVILTAEINGVKRDFEFKVNPLDVLDFIESFNFTYDKANVSGEFNLPTEVKLGDVTASITWESLSDLITINENKAKAPYTYEKLEAQIKATFNYNGESKSKTYTIYVIDKTVYTQSTEIKAETPYYMSFVQNTLGGEYYWVTGVQSGNYGATSLVMAEGAQFYATAVEGGYNLSYKTADGKNEILGVDDKGAKVYVKFNATEAALWQWNTEYNTFTYTNDNNTFYMGTYSSYNTLSMSALSYAPTSFVSHFYTEAEMNANAPTYTDNDKVFGEYLSYSLDENIYAGETEILVVGKKFNDVTISYELKEAVEGVTVSGNKLTVDVTEAKEVVLKVTFTLNDQTMTKEVTFTARPAENQTIADFLAAKDADKVVLLTGVVTAVNKVGSKGSFVLSDETGSIFCYTNLDVALGDEIVVKATYSENYTLPQIGNPVLVETKSTGNDFVAASGTITELTASDIAAKLEGSTNQSLTDEFAGKYLSIKGYALKSGNFTNLFATADSTTAVVNLYANADLNLASYQGKQVIIKGFVRGVNGGKNITVQIQSIEEVPLTAEEKVQGAMDAFTFADSVPGTITLPTASDAYADVALSFALKEGTTAASIAEGVLTLNTVTENTEVTLVVTFTLGDIVQTKEVTFQILGLEKITIAEAIKLANDTQLKVQGVVVAVETNGYIIYDGTDAIYVYVKGSLDADFTWVVGDSLEVIAKRGNYNGDQIVPIAAAKKLETALEVEVPTTPEVFNATDMATYLAGTTYDVIYVEMTGKLLVSGNYLNLEVEGLTGQGSIKAAGDLLTQAKALADKKVTVKGYTYSISKKSDSAYFVNTIITSIEEVVLPDADKVAAELAELSISNVDSEASVDLVLNGSVYTDVAFTYALKDETVTAVVIADGKITAAAVTKDTDVVIVVTATLGDAVQTKEITIKVLAPLGPVLATFTFGDNGEAVHKDGTGLASGVTTLDYTDGSYSLNMTACTKVYTKAYDAIGNSCLKFGTSSGVASFKFTVPADVNNVVLYVAGYKTNTGKVSINGTVYEIKTLSNNGEYTPIVINTSETKTVEFATVSGTARCMMDKIEYR